MGIVTGIIVALIVLYYIGMVIENHYWKKNRASRPPVKLATEQDLLDCLRHLKNGQEPNDFEKLLIKEAMKTNTDSNK